jgi:hypothetical protein
VAGSSKIIFFLNCWESKTPRVHKAFVKFLLKTSPIEGEADNKTSAGGGRSPNVAIVIENSLPGEGQPKPKADLLACCDERFEQPVANPARNSRPRIFQFDQRTITSFPGYNAELPSSRHRFETGT